MKVLLIQPPVQDFYDTDVRLQPIGLAYLKAAVNKHLPEVDVIIRDYHAGCGRRTVAIPKELGYLKDYYSIADSSPFSTFDRYYHFGKPFDSIETEITEIRPEVVGISSLFTPYYREVLEIAARVKKRLSVPVVVGGSHASAVPESMLASPWVDYVIRGEGEKPLVELLRYLQGESQLESVPNLSYKRNGRQCSNPTVENFPIDELPFPDLSDTSPSTYQFGGKPLTFMITSRSCPHKCSFCSVHTTFGANYRRRSLENVLGEIELRYLQGYRVIDFEDDNLTYYKKTFKELCRRLIARFPHREMEFVAMNGISYLSLDDELLELMYQAGFSHLNLALVSSDKTVRETTKRPHTLEAYLKIVGKAHALGFKLVSYQILGLPNESLESMIQTLAFNAQLPVLIGASPFYRTPDAPIARGLELTETDYVRARLTAMAVETDGFSRDEIYTLFVTTRILNFLKGLPVSTSIDLDSVMQQRSFTARTEIGFELLRKLAGSGRMYFWTRRGLVENRRFRGDVFRRVIS
ncbi:MAG TPA: radical SAM protein, partial [Candidatus Polarisedimenticolaceae bacterium]|nr:radical SAM protein [Candidatus Polarisedimenticolaceae bacterium]